jgi:hypothetical protein
MDFSGKCELCGSHDDYLYVRHVYQAVIVDGETLWRDVGTRRICGACACISPRGWRVL